MKPLVIFHGDGSKDQGYGGCADGFGAAFAAWLKLGDDAEYLPCQYESEDHKGAILLKTKDREVYILDFSFPREVTEQVFATAKRVVWLDHHKTAFEMWCGIQYLDTKEGVHQAIGTNMQHTITLNNFKSGAMLAWEYFHPGTEVPMLIKHIDDYDRWQFKIEGTKEFNKALWSYAPWNFEQWWRLFYDKKGLGTEKRATLLAEGAAILRAHDQNVQSVVKGGARECRISFPVQLNPGITGDGLADGEWFDFGLAANCPPHLTSDVGHQLANQSGTFGLCWTLSQTGYTAKCSLRSNGGYDVSAIAKAFGGGGHKNAAGFEVPLSTLIGWLK